MTKICYHTVLAAVLLGLTGLNHAGAYPQAITLPSAAISVPPLNPNVAALLGSWQDGHCHLLPPGITPFEAVSDTITFRQDGTFTQVINKATGRLKETGTYMVADSHLTLNYLVGSGKPNTYEFSCKGDTLLLQPTGAGAKEVHLDRGRS